MSWDGAVRPGITRTEMHREEDAVTHLEIISQRLKLS